MPTTQRMSLAPNKLQAGDLIDNSMTAPPYEVAYLSPVGENTEVTDSDGNRTTYGPERCLTVLRQVRSSADVIDLLAEELDYAVGDVLDMVDAATTNTSIRRFESEFAGLKDPAQLIERLKGLDQFLAVLYTDRELQMLHQRIESGLDGGSVHSIVWAANQLRLRLNPETTSMYVEPVADNTERAVFEDLTAPDGPYTRVVKANLALQAEMEHAPDNLDTPYAFR